MARCDLANHPNACSIAQSRYPRAECAGCEAGKKNDAITVERLAKGAPPVPRETIQPKKEESVATEGEKILARIQREKVVGKSKIMQYDHVPGAEVQKEAEALQSEGKIKIWPGKSGGTLYTLPDAPDPLADSRKKEPPPKKKSPSAPEEKKKTTPRAKPLPATGKTVVDNKPPGNGGGRTGSAYEPIIADLMAQRQKIDNAIAALRELG